MEEAFVARFRAAFPAAPRDTFREWYLLQDELREGGHDDVARALADDLWALAPALPFAADGERASFFHNFAVFLGSLGPAASLARSREAFRVALGIWPPGSSDHARAQQNEANAIQALAKSKGELDEAIALYREALVVRTAAVARGVTLHNLGVAFRRLAELDPGRRDEHLGESEAALRAALALRREKGLGEGEALTLFHLALTQQARTRPDADSVADAFDAAATRYDALERPSEAALCRRLARGEGFPLSSSVSCHTGS